MRVTLRLFLVFLFYGLAYSQTQPQVQVGLTFTDTDNITAVVKFGIDPTASDTIDSDIGEGTLPPWSPQTDLRFVLPYSNFNGIESYRDYRQGTVPFSGQVEHRLKFQLGQADSLQILYDLPSGITIDVQDLFGGVLVNTQFSGNGRFTIPEPNSIVQLKLVINYNNVDGPELRSDLTFSDWQLFTTFNRTLSFGLDPLATDTIDVILGEERLTSFSADQTEVRLFLPEDNFSGGTASYSDYRNGSLIFTGQKEFRIRFQTNPNYGDSLKLSYTLPAGVNINLQDLSGSVININLSGSGTYVFHDVNDIQQLKMFVNYGPDDVKQESDLIPRSIELVQNYPNPFNPTTKIKFSITELSDVSLIVYDLLGKEVAALVNEQLLPGSYSVDFDASSFSSGTYFYRLNVGGNIISKKMVLLK